MRSSSEVKVIKKWLQAVGWDVDTFSPGDGMTRYRIVPRGQSYFSADGPTACGAREAVAMLRGWWHGRTVESLPVARLRRGALAVLETAARMEAARSRGESLRRLLESVIFSLPVEALDLDPGTVQTLQEAAGQADFREWVTRVLDRPAGTWAEEAEAWARTTLRV